MINVYEIKMLRVDKQLSKKNACDEKHMVRFQIVDTNTEIWQLAVRYPSVLNVWCR